VFQKGENSVSTSGTRRVTHVKYQFLNHERVYDVWIVITTNVAYPW